MNARDGKDIHTHVRLRCFPLAAGTPVCVSRDRETERESERVCELVSVCERERERGGHTHTRTHLRRVHCLVHSWRVRICGDVNLLAQWRCRCDLFGVSENAGEGS